MLMTIYLYLILGFVTTFLVLVSHVYQTREGLFNGPNILEWSWKNRWANFIDRILLPFIGLIVTSIFWPFLLFLVAKEIIGHFTKKPLPDIEANVFKVRQHHLREKFTLDEVEQREIVIDPLHAVPAVPFGHLNAAWEAFKKQMQPNDELWSFIAEEPESKTNTILREGYVIKRKRKLIGFLLKRIERI